tara:strand:+ start:44 stop:316 length:273 start_codon:yes stop_codon:yes gene_type:complete
MIRSWDITRTGALMSRSGKKYYLDSRKLYKKNIATEDNYMTEKEILNVVYKQILLAHEQELTDTAPQHFKQLKEFIENERKNAIETGGWL